MTRHEPSDPTAAKNLLADQREANEHMVLATLRALEQSDQAKGARVRTEEMMAELRASEDRYRTLFDLCPAGVYSCDASGVIQKFNQHAVELWGREPAVGDTDERFCGSFKLFRPDGSFMPHEQCPMADVVSGKIQAAQDLEVLIERPDGSRVVAIVNIRPLKNERGEVVGAINCFYDISGRKAAEEQVADSLSRERELAEFREMFIGILGHDLRTPLGSMIGSAAALIRRDDLVEQDAVAAARIIRSGQRMNRMISRLLDLTRARLGGGLSIEPEPTDLREICQGVVEEFETHVELQMEGDVTGTWDEDRLAEVLSNLVANAIRFAAAGTVVAMKTRGEDAEVVVEVINEGEAISPDVLPFIFEPFRKAQRPGKSTGNLGLGLYIANQIVRDHGGTLAGASANGTTTFTMRLPRVGPRNAHT